MKNPKLMTAAAALMLAAPCRAVTVTSPDGNVSVDVDVVGGKPTYSMTYKNKPADQALHPGPGADRRAGTCWTASR